MPHKPCDCCRGKAAPDHAIINLVDTESGHAFKTRVPHAHRYDSVGWHDRPRLSWDGDDGERRTGIEVSRGKLGLTVADNSGEHHRVDHDTYEVWSPVAELDTMEKAAKPLKAGQRWITVHAHGKGEKGTPVLIEPNPDGTHRIVAGAGGKLTHLRLKNVRSEEEYAEDAKEKGKERRTKETERKAKQTPEERTTEKRAKLDVKADMLVKQREFINKIRDRLGGVDEDIDESGLAGMSPASKNVVLGRHHRKQLSQAKDRSRDAREKLVEHAVSEAEGQAAIEHALEENPELGAARDLAAELGELDELDRHERSEERAARSSRSPGGARDREQVADVSEEAVQERGDVSNRLNQLGGRDDDKKGDMLRQTLTASEELERRSLQEHQDAADLFDAADSGELDDTAKKALKRAGVKEESDTEVIRDTLRSEAARKQRRSEALEARSEKFQRTEHEEGFDVASRQLAFSDVFANANRAAATAKDLGLLDVDRVPVSDAELSELHAVMQDEAEMRALEREYRKMNKSIEKGDYDRSRRAFDLQVDDVAGNVSQSLEDRVRRKLTERLLGVANQRDQNYMSAVGNAHYAQLADVALGISGERYIDRPTVDALGLQNAAVLNRWALTADGHEEGTVLDALESTHVESVGRETSEALRKANEFVPELTHTIDDVGSLETAVEMLDAHEQDLEDVQRAVGAAIGKMEATATMGQAYREKMPEHLTVQAGDVGLDGTLQWMHAIGLKPGDYVVDYGAKSVSIPQTSWGKLVQREGPEIAARRKEVAAIKRGEHDEDGWMPQGLISREASSFTNPVPESPRYWEPLNHTAEDLGAELYDHVGRRLADGEPPGVIMRDLRTPVMMDGSPDRDAYLAEVNKLFPMRDEDGEFQKPEFFKEHYDKVVSDWSKKSGKSPYDAQSIDLKDVGVHEAIYRTVADEPRLKYAHTPIGELDHKGRRAIRDYFYERQGISDTRNYDAQYERAMGHGKLEEPEVMGRNVDMWSPPRVNPDWVSWRKRAIKVVQMYPKQGLDLARRMMAVEKPESVRYNEVSDEHVTKMAELMEEYPRANARTMWLRMGMHFGFHEAPSEVSIGQYHAPEFHQRQMDRFESRAKAAATPWTQYVDLHGSTESGLMSLQDEMKGRFSESFREHHGKITGKPLQRSPTAINNQEIHATAVGTPEEQAVFRAKREKEMEALAERDALGQFQKMGGKGSRKRKHAEGMEQETAAQQVQSVLFGVQKQGVEADWAREEKAAPTAVEKGPAPTLAEPIHGERWSLGERTESQLASIVPEISKNFEAGKPVGLFAGANMDKDRVVQQRVLKALEANGGRLGGYLGTGTGKTPISIGAFTDAHAKGKVDRGLFLVPVAVQQQYGGEMHAFTEPGKYRWNTNAQGHEERVAALRDPDTHMVVMTHQGYRDTVLKMMGDHHGQSREELLSALKKADRSTAAQWMQDALKANGIKGKWYTYLDEAHLASSRTEDRAALALVAEMATHPTNSTSMLLGTATPHKNDEAELYSMAAMIDPHKYGDRAKFMAAFGEDIRHNPDAIRRELEHQTYSEKIDPKGVERTVTDNPQIIDGKKVSNTGPMKLEPEHQAHVDEVSAAYDRARAAHRRGEVDVDAIKRLSPGKFEGRPESEHEAIAHKAGDTLPMSRDQALRRAINQAPPEINTKLKRLTDVVKHDMEHGEWVHAKTGETHKGKPSIIFTDRKKELDLIVKHLQDQGLRVAGYHGAMNTAAREKVRNGYQPSKGEPIYDVLVATSAAEAGINLQRAKAVHHYDVPMTSKSWNQRTGRAFRQKQMGDVDVHDWHTDHEFETRARRRLQRKQALGDVFETPLGALDEHGIAAHYQQAIERQHSAHEPDEMPIAAK